MAHQTKCILKYKSKKKEAFLGGSPGKGKMHLYIKKNRALQGGGKRGRRKSQPRAE
jgi:hypothetical protein